MHIHIIFKVIFLALFCFQYSCAIDSHPPCIKNGVEYCKTKGNFTGRWYSYYKRAMSCLKGDFYENALYDLNKAIKLKENDQWWANTYGMHFMDYFPHREKGIIHYKKSLDTAIANPDLYTAKSELEISIMQESSERAKCYLNKVKKLIVEREHRTPSIAVFTLKLPSGKEIKNEIWTNKHPFTILGIARDNNYISDIIVHENNNEDKILIKSFEKEIAFNKEFKFNPGKHKIDFTVYNLSGQQNKRKLIVHIDRSGPIIDIKEFNPDVGIRGYVFDTYGVKLLKAIINGYEKDVNINKDGLFEIIFDYKTDEFVLSAYDLLDNITTRKYSANTIAKNDSLLLAESSGLLYNSTSSLKHPHKKTSIKIDKWADKQVVFDETIQINGQVISQNPIINISIEIEKKQININNINSKVSNSTDMSFSYLTPLNVGSNIISISSIDEHGKKTIKKITIIRKFQEVLKHKYRYTFKMYPFDTSEWKSDFSFIQRLLFSAIYWRNNLPLNKKAKAKVQFGFAKNLESKNRFQVMTDETLNLYFTNYNLGFPTTNNNLKSYHSLLIGDTNMYKDEIEVIVRMIDINTSEIIATKDAYRESEQQSDLLSISNELSNKFHQEFPLIYGTIVESKDGKARVSFESEYIKDGWPIIVYEAKQNILAETQMENNNIIFIKNNINIKTGDKVLSK